MRSFAALRTTENLTRRRSHHDAVGLAALQGAADAVGLLLVERPALDAIPHALVAEIDAYRLHAEVGHHVAMRALQARPGRLGDILVLDRSDLHPPTAGRARYVVDQAGDAGTGLRRPWLDVRGGGRCRRSRRRGAGWWRRRPTARRLGGLQRGWGPGGFGPGRA